MSRARRRPEKPFPHLENYQSYTTTGLPGAQVQLATTDNLLVADLPNEPKLFSHTQ